jgi:signal transduction histidine kinase
MRKLRTRLSLRLKMTLIFTAAMALLLAALGVFVYSRVQSGLDRSLNQALHSRAEDVRALVLQADTGLRQAGTSSLAAPGERFTQVLARNGTIIDQTPSLPAHPILSAALLARASAAPVTVGRTSDRGAIHSSRVLAVPVRAQGERLIVVVGASLRQRDATLSELRAVLTIGGPVALLLASLLGYAVAALALRNVESMRRRAQHISLDQPGQRLPVPGADDELARLARTLNEMLARNEAAFLRERAFVADASHELRSPLAILRAELDVALIGDSSSDELRAAITSAAEEAGRLSSLAENLLTLAETDQTGLPVRRQPIDVGETLRRVRDRFLTRASAADGGVIAIAPQGLRINADPLRIEQALNNLLDNALRHGASAAVVRVQRNHNDVELHVRDNGPGFPAAILGSAFERFTRGDRARTAGGAGLGLSIVQSIARAHGGEARLANCPAGGADVCLCLPGSALGSVTEAHLDGDWRERLSYP